MAADRAIAIAQRRDQSKRMPKLTWARILHADNREFPVGFPFIQNPPCQFLCPGLKRAQLPQRSHIGVCLGQLQLLGDLSDLVDQVGIVALSQPRTLFFWAASNLWVGIQSSAPMLPKILDPASKMGLSRSPTSSIVASQLADSDAGTPLNLLMIFSRSRAHDTDRIFWAFW